MRITVLHASGCQYYQPGDTGLIQHFAVAFDTKPVCLLLATQLQDWSEMPTGTTLQQCRCCYGAAQYRLETLQDVPKMPTAPAALQTFRKVPLFRELTDTSLFRVVSSLETRFLKTDEKLSLAGILPAVIVVLQGSLFEETTNTTLDADAPVFGYHSLFAYSTKSKEVSLNSTEQLIAESNAKIAILRLPVIHKLLSEMPVLDVVHFSEALSTYFGFFLHDTKSGLIGRITVETLLASASAQAFTGSIQLDFQNDLAVIHLQNGEVTHVDYKGQDDSQSLLELLAVSVGSFSVSCQEVALADRAQTSQVVTVEHFQCAPTLSAAVDLDDLTALTSKTAQQATVFEIGNTTASDALGALADLTKI